MRLVLVGVVGSSVIEIMTERGETCAGRSCWFLGGRDHDRAPPRSTLESQCLTDTAASHTSINQPTTCFISSIAITYNTNQLTYRTVEVLIGQVIEQSRALCMTKLK